MKKLILALLTVGLLAGCSHAPTHILAKNCKALGSGLYDCEEIPKKDVQGGAKHL